MDFRYTDEQLELRERAQRLTDAIIEYEDACEAGRGLPDESLAEIQRMIIANQVAKRGLQPLITYRPQETLSHA